MSLDMFCCILMSWFNQTHPLITRIFVIIRFNVHSLHHPFAFLRSRRVETRWKLELTLAIKGSYIVARVHSTPAFCFNIAMKLSLSSGVIPAAEQSPTPHSAPRKQYLSSIDLLFLKDTRTITIWLMIQQTERTTYANFGDRMKADNQLIYMVILSSKNYTTEMG